MAKYLVSTTKELVLSSTSVTVDGNTVCIENAELAKLIGATSSDDVIVFSVSNVEGTEKHQIPVKRHCN